MNKIFKFFLASSFGLLTFTFGVFGSEELQELYECSVISEKLFKDFTVVNLKDYNKDLQEVAKDFDSDWKYSVCYFLGRLFAILDCTSDQYIMSMRNKKFRCFKKNILCKPNNCNKFKTIKTLIKALPTITSYGEKCHEYSIFEKAKRMLTGENTQTNWQNEKYYKLDGGDICIPMTLFCSMDTIFLGDVDKENKIGGRSIQKTWIPNLGKFKLCTKDNKWWWLEYKSPSEDWVEVDDYKKNNNIEDEWEDIK